MEDKTMSREVVGFNEAPIVTNIDMDRDLKSENTTVIHFLVDESYSLKDVEDIVEGELGDVKEAIKGSKVRNEVVVAKTTFADYIHYGAGYTLIEDFDTNYLAEGESTRLFDAIVEVQKGLSAYTEELLDRDHPTRAILIIMTDGRDNDSNCQIREARQAIMNLYQEETAIYFIEFGDVARGVANDLGIKQEYILSAGDQAATQEERASALRKALRFASQSAISISQGAVPPTVSQQDPFA